MDQFVVDAAGIGPKPLHSCAREEIETLAQAVDGAAGDVYALIAAAMGERNVGEVWDLGKEAASDFALRLRFADPQAEFVVNGRQVIAANATEAAAAALRDEHIGMREVASAEVASSGELATFDAGLARGVVASERMDAERRAQQHQYFKTRGRWYNR